LMGLAFSALLPAGSALAADLGIADAISDWLDLHHPGIAVLATAFALLGFSVVSAILLMRNRTRAARNENKLRAQINELTAQTDRLSALLFAEPPVLISWAAGGDPPRIGGGDSLFVAA